MATSSQLDELRAFCAEVGSDPMLTQAAGGNVSVKIGPEMWIKASGTWLSEALDRDIFVPVDLPRLEAQIAQSDFATIPQVSRLTNLRPSIETVMHGCLPQRYVVHLHSIKPLSILVREDPMQDLQRSLSTASFEWSLIPYAKPGGPLAMEISSARGSRGNLTVLFLRNHGVVFGSDTVSQVKDLIHEVDGLLQDSSQEVVLPNTQEVLVDPEIIGWRLPGDESLHQLAVDPVILARLKSDWALFPDHVVFLGERPFIESSVRRLDGGSIEAQVIFVAGQGVFIREGHKRGLEEQLKAYLEVLVRQEPAHPLRSLSGGQVAELMNWDAERYRIGLQEAPNVS